MRICINTSSFPKFKGDYAGAFVFELARALVKKGHQVWVLCPAVKDTPLSENMDGVNIIRYRYAFPKSSQILVGGKPAVPQIQEKKHLIFFVPLLLVCQFFALVRLIRRHKIEVINSHWLLPQGFISAFCAKLFGLRHLSTLHSTDVYLAMKLPFAKYLSRFVEKTALSTFAVGSFVRDRYNSILGYHSRTAVVPMGGDEEKFHSVTAIEPDPDKILFVGRLHKIKGINYLFEAFAQLLKDNPKLKLEIVGGGEELENLKALANELGITEHLAFEGFVANNLIAKHYASASCVVVPSLILPSGETEGMPVVILESLLSGTPVVASNVGAICDIVEDGVNGFLVEPGNAEQLVAAIGKVLADKQNILRKNAFESCHKYYWSNISDVYVRGMTESVTEDL